STRKCRLSTRAGSPCSKKNCGLPQNSTRCIMLRPALDLVLSALEQIQENSERELCASRAAMARLFETNPGEPSKVDRLDAIRVRVSVCTKCPHVASSPTQT